MRLVNCNILEAYLLIILVLTQALFIASITALSSDLESLSGALVAAGEDEAIWIGETWMAGELMEMSAVSLDRLTAWQESQDSVHTCPSPDLA